MNNRPRIYEISKFPQNELDSGGGELGFKSFLGFDTTANYPF